MLVLGLLGKGIVDPSTPVVCADDLGVTRGDGCFEGLRVCRSGARPTAAEDDRPVEVQALGAHLRRMARSAAGLGIRFDGEAWEALSLDVAAAWATEFPDMEEATIKLVLTRGRLGADEPTGFATVSAQPGDTDARRRDGIDVVTLVKGTTEASYAGAPWLLAGVKTLSYALNMAAQREAAARGAHEALWVTTDGHLLEAPTSSVVWASGRTLATVVDNTVGDGVGNGILHSITVETLFMEAAVEGWQTVRGEGTPADLREADVAMLVSSGLGPLRIRSLDGEPLATSPVGLETLGACRRMSHFPNL